jgi:hypothetical protein
MGNIFPMENTSTRSTGRGLRATWLGHGSTMERDDRGPLEGDRLGATV